MRTKTAKLDRRRFLKLVGAAGALALPTLLGYDLLCDAKGDLPPSRSPYTPIDMIENWPSLPVGASPILLLINQRAGNPFGFYLTEILRTEGLNCFQVGPLSALDQVPLSWYDLVILAEGPLENVQILNRVSETIVFPVHPRTQKALTRLGACFETHVRLIEPVGYFDMMMLEDNARLIATDSGGVQREAYFLGIPCLTLRDETEWVETVMVGWNKLVGCEPEQVLEAWFNFTPPAEHPPIFGDGTAGQQIAHILTGEEIVFGQPGQQNVARQKQEAIVLEVGVAL